MKKALIIALASLACVPALAMAASGGTGGGGTGGGGGTTTTTTTSGGGTTTTSGGGGTTTTTAGGGGGGGGGQPNLVLNPGFHPVLHPGSTTDWEPWHIGYYALFKSTGFNGYTAFTPCNDPSCLAPDDIDPGPPWYTPPSSSDPYLVQAIATTPGKRYDVSFMVAEIGGPNSGFAFYWDGQLIATVANPANNTLPPAGTQQPDAKEFVKFSYPGLLATTSSTKFEFKGYQQNGAMFFGNPVVTLSAVQ